MTLVSFRLKTRVGFCVERHDQIQTFKPEPYWVLQVQADTAPGTDQNKTFSLEWERVRLFDKEVAVTFQQMIKQFTSAVVQSVVTKDKAKERPIALNTVELMRVASSGLGMSPQHAMMIAEKLYTQGYISYPRTESTQYADNFDLKDLVRQQQHSSDLAEVCKELLQGGMTKPRKGHDAGDHPPIT